jgi:hypothetical protein
MDGPGLRKPQSDYPPIRSDFQVAMIKPKAFRSPKIGAAEAKCLASACRFFGKRLSL